MLHASVASSHLRVSCHLGMTLASFSMPFSAAAMAMDGEGAGLEEEEGEEGGRWSRADARNDAALHPVGQVQGIQLHTHRSMQGHNIL